MFTSWNDISMMGLRKNSAACLWHSCSHIVNLANLETGKKKQKGLCFRRCCRGIDAELGEQLSDLICRSADVWFPYSTAAFSVRLASKLSSFLIAATLSNIVIAGSFGLATILGIGAATADSVMAALA